MLGLSLEVGGFYVNLYNFGVPKDIIGVRIVVPFFFVLLLLGNSFIERVMHEVRAQKDNKNISVPNYTHNIKKLIFIHTKTKYWSL